MYVYVCKSMRVESERFRANKKIIVEKENQTNDFQKYKIKNVFQEKWREWTTGLKCSWEPR